MTAYLRDALFWLAVACSVVASVAILRATVAASAGGRGRRLVEIAYAVVPAVMLAAVLAATWPRVRDARLAASHPPHPGPPSPAAVR